MEVLRQKGWGCGLADRDVVALSQVNESGWTNESEKGHRRERGADRGIDKTRSFAGAIAVGNENTMKAERTAQKGCGWTGTVSRIFTSCPFRKLLAAELGTPHFQLPLNNARFASLAHARNKRQVQFIYMN